MLSDFDLQSRQKQVAIMALLSSPEFDPSGAVGDALSGHNAKKDALSCAGLLLLHHRQSRHTHFLHGGSARVVLVWIYKLRERVCPLRATLVTSLISVKNGPYSGIRSLL